jgi:ADP-ribose pyrophosphatase YjhB (NUDIX family)
MSEPLHAIPNHKTVTAYDINGEPHVCNLLDFKQRVSVYGVYIENGRILMKRHAKMRTFDLPGGGIDIGETIEHALIREYKEETGLDVSVGKLLYASENMFCYEGENAHAIMLFYQIHTIKGTITTNDTDSVEVTYLPLNDIDLSRIHYTCIPLIKSLIRDTELLAAS